MNYLSCYGYRHYQTVQNEGNYLSTLEFNMLITVSMQINLELNIFSIIFLRALIIILTFSHWLWMANVVSNPIPIIGVLYNVQAYINMFFGVTC